jgi:hypothetical protein
MGGSKLYTIHSTLYTRKIALWQYDVRVEHDEPFAPGPFGTVVAALPRTAVLLLVIMQIKDVCVLVADILAGYFRSVLNNDDLKVPTCLVRKTLQQLVDFVWPVEDGNDD